MESAQEEEVFDIESKGGTPFLHGAEISRREEMEVLLSPEVFSRMVLLEDKSKVLLAPMNFFDEGFERRFKVGQKNGKYEILF